nr:hypothetical protein [uncultured Rhodoferax sp.]
MTVNDYLAKTYGPQPCWELVADVYATELQAIPIEYKTIDRSVREMASAFRLAIYKGAHGFQKVDSPSDFAIVLLSKAERLGIHHCGVYFDGRVLHALPGVTVYEELSVIRDAYEVVQFWAKA